MTQKEADAICAKLNSHVGFQIKFTSWNAMSLMNFGVDRQLLNSMPMHGLMHLIQRGKDPFILKYKEKLKNISV
jgi:hypothetical protein